MSKFIMLFFLVSARTGEGIELYFILLFNLHLPQLLLILFQILMLAKSFYLLFLLFLRNGVAHKQKYVFECRDSKNLNDINV